MKTVCAIILSIIMSTAYAKADYYTREDIVNIVKSVGYTEYMDDFNDRVYGVANVLRAVGHTVGPL